MKFSDSEILDAVQDSEGKYKKVLEYLYHQVLPKVENYVLKNSGNKDDAFDAFQDAMLAFCKYVRLNRFNKDYSVSGFIYSVAKNIWINNARKNKKLLLTEMTELSENESDSQNVLNYIITNERKEELKKMFDMLGEKCRKLLRMSIYQEMSGKEICKKLGFASENGVKTQKYKCKKKLLQIMKQQNTSLLES